MKYLNAKSYCFLKNSVMNFLDLSHDDYNKIIDQILCSDDIDDEIRKIVEKRVTTELEFIQMFHLSRRLNNSNLFENDNLRNLLLKKSVMTEFFKQYNVSFEKCNNKINLLYKNVVVNISDAKYEDYNGNIEFRLETDYCINGFAFREGLEKNVYYLTLSRGPEILYEIFKLLNIDKMIDDYISNSNYYCFEYLIPISKVIFDGYDCCITNLDKTKVFLKEVLKYLYYEMLGHQSDYLVIRIPDNENLKREWYKGSEKLVV